ncbi:DFPA-like protein [Mya arenaria]|uniref:DFPA-like protein n=1 Tax=Mya arenaria TaxID=6604 RepID=A0ABY7FMM9_MYAAR|nr:DFPA-like protein [Mya arenaria]
MANPEVITPQFTKIVENIAGAEGPVFDRNGTFYMVAPERTDESNNAAGDVVKVNLDNAMLTVMCSPRDGCDGGIPAGCQCDHDNNILIADMRLGILRMDSEGKYSQLFKKDSTDRIMQGCNDCAFDYEGNLWVTAPAGNIAPAPYARSFEEPFGSVYCLTKDQTLIRIDGDLRFPNGIAVQHAADGRPSKLIVAETPTKLLWQYDIEGPAKVGKRTVWGKLPGNLLVANWGGGHLEVFSSNGGDPKARIQCPFSKPSNVHFQPGSNTVYVTEHQFHGLWRFDWKCKGMKQYCETK